MALLSSLRWEWETITTSILSCIIVVLWMKLSQKTKFIKRQAEIALSRRPGESAIVAAKQNLCQWEESQFLDIGSLADSFIKSMHKYKDLEYFRGKSESGWESFSWCQVYEQAKDLGSGLKSLGLIASTNSTADLQNSLVGILLKNSSFWIVSDHACSMHSLISVPIHVSFNTQDLKSVLNHSKLTILITSLDKLKDVLEVKSKYLKFIILTVDSVPKEMMENGVEILSFKSVLEFGRKSLQKVELPLLNNVFTICYTSGTTGDPKGVLLTHGNMIEAGKGLLKIIPQSLLPGRNDAHLSFLPMSHIFERLNIHAFTWCGVQIGLASGDVSKFPVEIMEFKPTVFPTVPRLLTRVYSKIMEKLELLPKFKRIFFDFALGYKLKLLKNGILDKNTVWDRLIFSKISEKLGGRIKLIATGAAPVDPKILNFFRAVLGCEIVEGYGQTESCGTGTCTLFGDYENPWGTHVGPPFPGLQLKLVDVPSLGYFATDQPNPRGEICLSGPTIMKGYYKDDVKTSQTIRDGWLHTGDIAQILPNGTIQILDRVSNIFKLSQGEFICPENIENKLDSKYIAQIVIFGNPLDNFCTALVVPELEIVKVWAKENNLSHLDFRTLCQNPLLMNVILQDMTAVGKSNKLLGYQIPKRISLLDEPFTVESGFLTPSLKIKRKLVKKHFWKLICKSSL